MRLPKALIAFLLVVASGLAVTVAFAASMTVVSGRLSVFRPSQLPPTCGGPGSSTVTATADSWVLQDSPGNNNGSDADLYIQTKTGTPAQNRRIYVNFTMPTVPAGCAVSAATLRLTSSSAVGTRTLQAFRAGALWTEGGVTWTNQPGPTGSATNLTTSGTGLKQWNVLTQVQAIYSSANHWGFMLRDQTESSATDAQQKFNGRTLTNPPQLVVSWS